MHEDVLDHRANLRFSRIDDPRALLRRAALRLLAMDPRDETSARQHFLILFRSIGRIRPNVTRRVLLVQHIGEMRAVEGRCFAGRLYGDQAVARIGRDMVLIAEGRNGEINLRLAILFRFGLRVFDGPPSIAIPSGATWQVSLSNPLECDLS